MTSTHLDQIRIAEEDLLLTAREAQKVFDWFGERNPSQRATWHEACAKVLEVALQTPVDRPVALAPTFHGDWTIGLLAGWALARMGRAHPWAEPHVQVKNGVTTLGGGDLSVFQGPLTLSGTVVIDRQVLVVGGLQVDGLLDFRGNPGDCLLVVGDERVRALDVGWAHFVIGSFHSEVTRWSYDALNDGVMYVTGEARSTLELQLESGSSSGAEGAEANPLRAVLEPRVEGHLDALQVCRLVGAGTHRVIPDAGGEPRLLSL